MHAHILFNRWCKMDFRKRTKKLREMITKTITPKIWKQSRIYEGEDRPMINFLAKAFKHKMIGVEIGVSKGENAENMLKLLNIERLYLIDPYIPYIDADGKEYQKISELEELARNRVKKFQDKIEFIIKESSEAKFEIPNDLDFVYIDGNHNYQYVRQDIENYFPKVRQGGVIGGHDFFAQFFGLSMAVLEFAKRNDLKLHGGYHDWWIIKP